MTNRRSRRSALRPALRDDSGATLVLALIVVTVVSVVVVGLVNYAGTSVAATVALRSQADVAATADAGAQAAINDLRRSTYDNDTASATYPQCFGTTGTRTYAGLVSGSSGTASAATVTCAPDPATGAAGGLVPITVSNKPGNAILTLSTDPAEDGITVKALNNSVPFNVRGGIVSDSTIRVTNGTLASTTSVFAHTGCSGTIVATPAADCSAPTAADPNYPLGTSAVPAYRPVPANTGVNCPGKVMTFSPGYYDDAAALSDLMDGNGPCKDSVWWFQPGVYYFDFQNSAGTIAGISGSDEWLVKNGQLIAGRPVNSAGTVLSTPSSPATVPGACQNPIKSTAAVGVQFVFGGDSRLKVAGGADVEICGTYSTSRPPIAIYGLKAGTATPTTSTGAAATTVTGTGFTAPAGSTLTAAFGAADGQSAAVTGSGQGGTTATLTLSPFVAGAGVPAGSILTSAKLRFVYGPGSTGSARTVTVTPSSGTGTGTSISPAVPAVVGATSTVDLTADLASAVHASGLTGLSVDYSTKVGKGVTEQLDAVLLDLTYTVPTFRGETTTSVPGNCLAAAYTGGSAGQCAVVSTSPSHSGGFYIQGTTYVPAAPVDLTLSNISAQVLRFGVVSRVLVVKETGSISYVGPVIEIPDNSPGYGPGGTVVYLSVYVCPGTAACVTTGTPRLRVRVYIHDPTGVPVSGSREMVVQSWAVHR